MRYQLSRQKIVVTAFAICSTLLLFSVVVIVRGQVRVSRDQIESSIKTNLPPGTPRARVVQWLQTNQFEFSPTNLRANSAGKQLHDLYGVIRNSKSGLFGMCNLQVNFAFDAQGKLQRHSTDEMCTSL